jgi:dethiobiotin synthetase
VSKRASRPDRLLVVTGTGTEIGKTWVGAHLLTELRAEGRTVAARKPVQSWAPGDGPTDADVLAAATGEAVAAVCPPHRSYSVPMAPPMAAVALDLPVPTIDDLVAETTWPDGIDIGLVETAGGVRSPLAADGDTVTLAHRLEPDAVVLVADAGLGTINLVRLSRAALHAWPVVVALNRYDETEVLHRANRSWLRDTDDLTVCVSIAELASAVTR